MPLFLLLSSWLPVALWASLIFWMSSIPGLNSGWGFYDFILRKGAHVFEYAVLTGLLLRAIGQTWPALPRRVLLAASGVAAVLYAASDEFHQSFVPRRGPSVHDVVIDSVGVALSLFLYLKWRRRFAGAA